VASRFVYAQLQTSDTARAKDFYRDLCGWTITDDPPGAGPPYAEITVNDEHIAGIMPLPAAGQPSFWLAYFSVADVDAAVHAAETLGATVLVPATDIAPKGFRIAVLSDPTGAAFALRGPLR
jgi:uncharacterized protein